MFHIRWIIDRKSTRLNSSHLVISYAVFCLKKNKCDENGGRYVFGHGIPVGVGRSQLCASVVSQCIVHSDIVLSDGASLVFFFFFLKVRRTPGISPFSLHDALPI